MSDFDICITPRLAEPTKILGSFDLSKVDAPLTLEQHTAQFEVAYVLHGRPFGYGPGDLIMTLGSIVDEIDHMDSGLDHTITIVGYPVLDVHFESGLAIFLNRASFSGRQKPTLAGRVPVETVKEALRKAASSLWECVSLKEPD